MNSQRTYQDFSITVLLPIVCVPARARVCVCVCEGGGQSIFCPGPNYLSSLQQVFTQKCLYCTLCTESVLHV